MARRRQSPQRQRHEAMLNLAYRVACPTCHRGPKILCTTGKHNNLPMSKNFRILDRIRSVHQVHAARRDQILENGWRDPSRPDKTPVPMKEVEARKEAESRNEGRILDRIRDLEDEIRGLEDELMDLDK